MNTQDLQAKQSEVEAKFNDLKSQHLDIEVELHKLQGEWRLLTQLVKATLTGAGEPAPDPSSSVAEQPVAVNVTSTTTETVEGEQPEAEPVA